MTDLQYRLKQDLIPSATQPDVTIVVVPRERFQFAQESLDSLYAATLCPFQLIYIDNNSPHQLRYYLAEQAQQKGLRVVRSDRYLSPNAARNLGLQFVTSRYVVFVDNDVIFAPGWLEALVNCAEETHATVVGSLVCQYRPVHQTIHCAGGELMATDDWARWVGGEAYESKSWSIYEKTYFQNRLISDVSDRLSRQPTGFVEFHAMLVQMTFFQQNGLLDEGLCCTKEYLDFAMTVGQAGGTIYLEPTSVVTFLTHPPAPRLQWRDLPYFSLRWSDAWERGSLQHLQNKWNLTQSTYLQKRYKKLGWRRWEELIKSRMARLSWLGQKRTKWLKKKLILWEKRLNNWWHNRYTQAMARRLGCDPEAIAEGRNYPPLTLAQPADLPPSVNQPAIAPPESLAFNR